MIPVMTRIMLISMLFFGSIKCDKLESMMTSDQQKKSNQPDPEVTSGNDQRYPEATFAAGCFWGVEYVYQQVPGVLATAVGFMGGTVDDPSYKQVCYSDTNHAEVVHLKYDPEKISYEKLVKIFFKVHDPTTLNRQGPDVGTQYRSAVFFHDDQQKQTAEKVKAAFDASGEFQKPIVTEVTQADTFWKAEKYHQDYFKKNPNHPACHRIDFTEIKNILNED